MFLFLASKASIKAITLSLDTSAYPAYRCDRYTYELLNTSHLQVPSSLLQSTAAPLWFTLLTKSEEQQVMFLNKLI